MEPPKRIEEEINHFPEGSKNHIFLKQLLKNLAPDYLRESVRKELNESHADLSDSVQQYFKQHIIYTSAVKSVNGNLLEQNESSHDNTEFFQLNLLKKYVSNDKYCEKIKLFEGSQALLTKILESKQKSKSSDMFTKLVENNIKEFCIQLTEYILERKFNLHDWEKYFESAIKQLSQRVSILDCSDIKLNALKPELQKLLSMYYKELAEGIGILDQLLELFQQKLDCQLDQSKVAAYRSEHLFLKLQCLNLEVMISTYSRGAVQALTIIKGELDTKLEAAVKDIDRLNYNLEEFHILGPVYQQLVEKYQQLTENIEKHKSTIEYLKADIASKERNLSFN